MKVWFNPFLETAGADFQINCKAKVHSVVQHWTWPYLRSLWYHSGHPQGLPCMIFVYLRDIHPNAHPNIGDLSMLGWSRPPHNKQFHRNAGGVTDLVILGMFGDTIWAVIRDEDQVILSRDIVLDPFFASQNPLLLMNSKAGSTNG